MLRARALKPVDYFYRRPLFRRLSSARSKFVAFLLRCIEALMKLLIFLAALQDIKLVTASLRADESALARSRARATPPIANVQMLAREQRKKGRARQRVANHNRLKTQRCRSPLARALTHSHFDRRR